MKTILNPKIKNGYIGVYTKEGGNGTDLENIENRIDTDLNDYIPPNT